MAGSICPHCGATMPGGRSGAQAALASRIAAPAVPDLATQQRRPACGRAAAASARRPTVADRFRIPGLVLLGRVGAVFARAHFELVRRWARRGDGMALPWPAGTIPGTMRARRGLPTLLAAALFAAGAAAQTPPSADEVARYTGLHAAAHRGDLPALRRELAAKADPDRRDAHGRTPLHVATFARRHDAIRALVAAGADRGALDNDRYDAVTIAAVADDEPTLALLLELGASARLVTSRWDGTALIAAAHLGHDGVVRRLIAAGAPLDHVNNLHWTALIEAIVLGDGGPRHQACVRALLDAGASWRLADREGRTPLQLARARGYAAMVATLEQAGAR